MALDTKEVHSAWLQAERIIEDRGSQYSVTAARVTENKGVKALLKRLTANKKYAKATHNSYALRVERDGQIFESKNDDGETGAGMVILRILRKQNATNVCVVVTRWYGGTKLYADRFKHVQDATIHILNQ